MLWIETEYNVLKFLISLFSGYDDITSTQHIF